MGTLGKFTLAQEPGRGASARVFRAIDPGTGENVALKVVHAELWDRRDLRSRAEAEVRAVMLLRHPNSVAILEPLLHKDPPALALQYVDGSSLEDYQSRLPYVLAAQAFR